jgi:hypothetical protein
MQIIPAAVYLLCFATSVVCAVLLVRRYLRSRMKLLLWSALCFVGLSLSNFFLFLDLVVLPDVQLLALRHLAALAGVGVLLYGFIWEAD